MIKRSRGTITGIVQGVGFRPFIYQLALHYHLTGFVINTSQGVDLEVEGLDENIELFFKKILSESPPLSQILSVDLGDIPLEHGKGFEIRESKAKEKRSTLISPDVSICPECIAELLNPRDRRFRYPFINCTNCGPRYTIIMDIPYDRPSTTMKNFKMCQACRTEYQDPTNRRFHAQPNACWDCGPSLSLHGQDGNRVICSNPMEETISFLKKGSIVAIKGLGGFHLAVDAVNHKAVVRLRRRKHREEKPLALMVKDLSRAKEIAHVSHMEEEALLTHQRPIVILGKKRSHGLSRQVAPRNKYFGIMLPYTPIHYLLMEGGFRALIMTSGNMTEEPINIDNRNAFKHLKDIADYFLVHDRDIYLRSDDSIIRVMHKAPRQVRRSRGYVPVPVFLDEEMTNMSSVLAVGAELKNTVCLTKENRAFLSQHIGDMENLETLEFFHLTVSHLRCVLEIDPEILAHDIHPDYLASKFAKEQKEIPTMAVQHHHAHIVSCLAENKIKGPVIGLALDGMGLGSDGRLWGGEILLADLTSFKRVGHLDYVPQPGGDGAVRSPWKMALSYLHKTFGEDLFNLPIEFVQTLDRQEAETLIHMIKREIHSPLTSSCGRLFDAVSALIGLKKKIAYEGQAALELEMCQILSEKRRYTWKIEERDHHLILLTSDMINDIVEDLAKGLSRGMISSRFHNTLIEMFTGACLRLRNETGIESVAMSGGAFQNVTLLTGLIRSLAYKGFKVFSHSLVPTNDGGLSLGQAVCVGMRYGGMHGEFEFYG